MPRRLTSKELEELTGRTQPRSRSPRRNKYNRADKEDRTWEGKVYDSKAEMVYRRDILETMLKSGDVLSVTEQPRVHLGDRVNVYVPDYLVIPREGRPYFVDVKGMETAKFKKDVARWRLRGPLELLVVKQKGRGFETTDIIDRGSKLP